MEEKKGFQTKTHYVGVLCAAETTRPGTHYFCLECNEKRMHEPAPNIKHNSYSSQRLHANDSAHLFYPPGERELEKPRL